MRRRPPNIYKRTKPWSIWYCMALGAIVVGIPTVIVEVVAIRVANQDIQGFMRQQLIEESQLADAFKKNANVVTIGGVEYGIIADTVRGCTTIEAHRPATVDASGKVLSFAAEPDLKTQVGTGCRPTMG